jgi:hypothetical protein
MTTSDHDHEMIDRMLGPATSEVGCDECFELIDQYVDLELAGDDAAARFPRVYAHFQGCPVCLDEYEGLRELATLAESPDPGP